MSNLIESIKAGRKLSESDENTVGTSKELPDKVIPDKYKNAWKNVYMYTDYTPGDIKYMELNNVGTKDEFLYIETTDYETLKLFSDGKYWCSYDGDEDDEEFTNTIGAASPKDANKWLHSMLGEYGNTRYFPAEI